LYEYLSPDCLHLTHTVVIIDILLRTRAAMYTTIAAARHAESFPLFPNQYFWLVTMLQKNEKKCLVLLWGPLFVGAPVRPNMLNMPKSASEYEPANSDLLSELLGVFYSETNVCTMRSGVKWRQKHRRKCCRICETQKALCISKHTCNRKPSCSQKRRVMWTVLEYVYCTSLLAWLA